MSKPFEFGLVMAGAVSAGAYSAGVMDFLIEALDTWHAARARGDDVPPHDVRLKVMTGTSAGAMTTGMAAAALCSEHHPVHDPRTASTSNKLFQSWVKRIDMSALLGLRDMVNGDPVRSLLDSTVLGEIALDALFFRPAARRRAWVDEQLHLLFCVGNLRGIPYNLAFSGAYQAGHDYRVHADFIHMLLSESGLDTAPGALPVDRSRQRVAAWEFMGQAALASGAFPLGLAPRMLRYRFEDRDADIYWQRPWRAPGEGGSGAGAPCETQRQVAPTWSHDPARPPYPLDYEFLCVDGGTFNNEPLDHARRMLSGGGRNPRNGLEADRAMIMIDPFPVTLRDTPLHDTRLLSVFTHLVSAWISQSRFKPEDIALAHDESVYSRFLIAPTRRLPDGTPAEHPIACGSVGAFGGFLSEGFRVHDFMLGRRNARAFLENHFTLPEGNPLFADWSDAQRRRHGRDASGGPMPAPGPDRHLPVIPVLADITFDPDLPDWRGLIQHRQVSDLRDPLVNRLEAVADRIVDDRIDSGLIARLLKSLIEKFDDEIADKALEYIRHDLKAFGLLS